MCSTVNQPGVQYRWMAQGSEGNAFTPLGRPASKALDRVNNALLAALRAEEAGKRPPVGSTMILNCVHKLEAVAYHLSHLRAYKAGLLDRIRRAAEGAPLGTAAFLEPEIVFEFEALILQARAALDAVTWFLSRACGQKTSTFKRLRNALSGRAAGDSRIRQCLSLLDQCEWMSSSKVLVAGDQSTRSYIAHYGSLLSAQQTCFAVSGIDAETALLFDMEMRGDVPVMATGSKLQEEVLFFVTAALSVFLELPLPEKKAFASDLGRQFVVLSESVAAPGDGIQVGVIKEMRLGGFTVGDVTVSKDVLARAVSLRSSPPRAAGRAPARSPRGRRGSGGGAARPSPPTGAWAGCRPAP